MKAYFTNFKNAKVMLQNVFTKNKYILQISTKTYDAQL